MKIKSIRFQWIAFSLLISIIPLIVLQLAYFVVAKGRIVRLMQDQSQQKVEQLYSIAAGKVKDEKEGLLLLHDFLTQQPVNDLDSLKIYIANYFFTYRGIYSRISILTSEGKQKVSFLTNFNPEYLYERTWEERSDLKGLTSEQVINLTGKVNLLGILSSVYGYSERIILLMENLGIILADLRLKSILEDAADKVVVSAKDDIFIFDQKKTILCATEPAWNNQRVDQIVDGTHVHGAEGKDGPFVYAFSSQGELWSAGIFIHYGSLLQPLWQTLNMGLWLTGLFFVLIVFVIWFLTHRLKQSFEPLILATEEIASGNLDYRVSRSSFQELNVLGSQFNDMASQLKSVLKEMAQKEQMAMLGEFSSFVIHDLKSPLSAMELLAENLDEEIQESPLSKSLSKYTRDLSLGIQKLEEFVEKILDFVRPIEINAVKTDLNYFLEQVVKEMPIPVELDLDYTIPLVSIDEDQFKRVILNIVNNADEAIRSREDGEIIIRTFLKNNDVCIDIRDNGIGIPAEETSKVFDLFYTTKPRVGGHGIGLTIVKRIVEAHNGEIAVQSEVNKGTTFTIELSSSR